MAQKTQKDATGIYEGTPEDAREAGQTSSSRPVSAVMTRNVEVVSPDAGLEETAEKMRRLDVGVIPVCDGQRLVGMITDRDITIKIVAARRNPATAKVREAMNEGVVYCFDDQDVQEAAQLMADKQLRRLPILNRDKRLVGIVSIGDVAAQGDPGTAGHALSGVARPGTQKPR